VEGGKKTFLGEGKGAISPAKRIRKKGRANYTHRNEREEPHNFIEEGGEGKKKGTTSEREESVSLKEGGFSKREKKKEEPPPRDQRWLRSTNFGRGGKGRISPIVTGP